MAFHPRFILILSAVMTVFASLTFFIGWNATQWMDAAHLSYDAGWFWTVLYVVAFSYILGRVPLPKAFRPLGRLIKVIGSYYIFLFEIGFILCLIADIGGAATKLAGGNLDAYAEIAGYVVIAIVIGMFALGTRNGLSPIVRRYELDIDKEGGIASTWTIVVASDIHLGNVIGNRHLRKLVKRVEAIKPDLVLLPGDVIDDSIEPFLRNEMSKTLGLLKARYGVYAVLGNHEYYGGHIPQYIEEMRKVGIRVMQDETVEIAGSLYIVGRKDKTAEASALGGRLPVSGLVEGLDLAKPVIMMDHQPTKFQQAADAGVDLMLSGHTHRGQFAPNHWITKRIFELDWGYMRKNAMHVIVSSGFGLWGPPIRIASRSEIIHVTLKFK
ncbi:metallophosphoesterase [Cohnella yongneupensis]|uniref:Metallophosphoesterase n=1 Tax=Cohnella yongneupensis TaxID=425006 RepID=A0ABW0R5F4_9BACL